MSDTQAYKQFGNSVVVPVIKEVARIMLPHIHALQRHEETGSPVGSAAQSAFNFHSRDLVTSFFRRRS